MSPRWRRAANLIAAMAAFSAVALVAFRLFAVYDKSLVWEPDGIAQHFPSLYFFNLWVREFLHDPSAGLPLWSWTIGLGSDIISTLSFHVVGDPFALVSLAVPMRWMEYAYALAFALRLLCAGLFSMLYLRKMGAKWVPTLTGAILYVFATFLFFSTMRHPFFANGMVFLPLLLMGAENALARRRSWTFVAAVFIAAVGNFYFFYMLTLVTVLYAVARYFELAEKPTRWRRLPLTALRLAGLFVLGVMLAMPILLPTLVAILHTARGQSEYTQALFYSVAQYRTMIAALAAGQAGANSTFLGFGYLGFLLVPVLYLRPGRSALKFLVGAFAVFVFIPVFGSLFNGLTFPSNRFAFIWGIFLALSAALVLSDDQRFTRREILAMAGTMLAYVALMLFFGPPLGFGTTVPMAIGVLTIAALAFEVRSGDAGTTAPARPTVFPAEWRTSAARWAVLGLLVANVLANQTMIQDVRAQGTLAAHVDRGQVRKRFMKSAGSLAADLPKGEFYRVMDLDSIGGNAGMVLGFPSTSFYFSIMNGYLTDLKKEIRNPTGWSSFSFNGFDDRAEMTALVGTGYYLARRGTTDFVPYGFEPYAATKRNVAYRNKYALPLGFVYDSVMPRSQYETMTALDKQSAMLQAAVVDDGAVSGVPTVDFEPEAVEVTYTVEFTDNATLDRAAGTLVRTARDGSVMLRIDPVPDAELYAEINDFDNVAKPPLARTDAEKAKARDFEQPNRMITYFSAAHRRKKAQWNTPSSPYYWGNDSQLVNFGYLKNGTHRVKIAPREIGTLSFESLKIWALPMAGFPARIERLRQSPLTGVKMGRDTVTGTVTSPKGGVLFLSIPYSSGWTATVDGTPVELLRVNTAFMGVRVTPGEHDIELRYVTPGLKAGLAAAAVSALVLALLAAFGIVRSRRVKRTSE